MTKSFLIKSIILIITLCIVFSFKPKDDPKFREYIKSFDVIKSPLSVFYNCPLHPIVKNHNRYFDSLLFSTNEFPISVVRDTLATVSFLVYEINTDRPYGRLNLKTYDYSVNLIESNTIDSEEEVSGADWSKIDTALNREHAHCPFVSYFTLLSSNVLSRSDAESSMSEDFMSDGSSTIVTSVGGSEEDTFNIYPFHKIYQKYCYYFNGRIKEKINYLKGKKEGEWNYFYDNGQLSLKINYLNGKENGECIYYYENGQIRLKRNYLNGEYTGEVIEYLPNGQIMPVLNYQNNIENGESVTYYDHNGLISLKENYLNGKKNGECIKYYYNGYIKSKSNWVNGELNGESINYYKNGQIESKENYLNEQLNGELKRYYENGQIESKENYLNEQLNGELIKYYENEQIKQKGNWVNGVLHGESIDYF